MADEPVCTEINVSASCGGKVQIIKFEFTADYHYSASAKYSIPEGWTEDQITEFRQAKYAELRVEVEGPADREMTELLRQRDELNGN